MAKALSYTLKIAINATYGLSAAKYDNPFHSVQNIDNFIAKRGSLFMVNLKHEVQRRGYTVAHIKTDSIKIPNATPSIIDFVHSYGKLYGYTFEHESTYDRMCLVNDAVYIARYSEDDPANEHPGEWTATGTQFQVPFVFKTLFSHEPITSQDLCETKSCTTALYLDMNEQLPDVSMHEKELDKIKAKIRKLEKVSGPEEDFEKVSEEIKDLKKDISVLKEMIAEGHNYVFIGKVGLFIPVKSGKGGDGHVSFRRELYVPYFTEMSIEAIAAIEKYGDFNDFIDISGCSNAGLPWTHEPVCGEHSYDNCLDCPHWKIQLDHENFEEMFGCDKI